MARYLQILMLCAMLIPCGCAEEEGEGPAGGFRILTTQPPDGSAAVPETVVPRVLFNKEIPEQMTFDMSLYRGSTEEEIRCTPGEDTSTLECTPEEPLHSSKIYRLLADLDQDGVPESETMFSTALPRGPAFDIGQQLVVERVGNSDSAPGLLEMALVDDQTTMVVVFNEFKLNGDVLPSDGYMLLGMAHDRPFATEEGEIVADGEFGYVISAPGTVQPDGGFLAEVEYAYMPLLVSGQHFQLLLRSLEIRGSVDSDLAFSYVTEVHAEAWIPVVAMQEMIDALSEWGNVLDDMTNIIAPDLDTNLDDELDACLFRFTSAGPRVTLVESKDPVLD